MRLNKKFTINNYINMKCCWRSVAVTNDIIDDSYELDVIDIHNEEFLNIDISLCKHNFLGSGHYGNCYKIVMNDKDYTCKKIKKSKNNRYKKEVTILKSLKTTEYLPEYCASFTNLLSHYILYNYISGKDLYQSLQEGFFEFKNKIKVLRVVHEISNGLFELFNHNLVHLDIKLENIILVNRNPIRIKLIDLESCQKINNKHNTYCGTPGYASPEMILQHKYYYNTDVWSLGIILYMLYTHDNFLDKNLIESENFNYLEFFDTYNKNYIKNQLILSNCFDEEIYELLSVMLHKLHVYRISIHGLKKHKLLLLRTH